MAAPQLNYSIANEPLPLTPEQRHILGWSAATNRLIDSAKVTVRESLRRRRELDEVSERGRPPACGVHTVHVGGDSVVGIIVCVNMLAMTFSSQVSFFS